MITKIIGDVHGKFERYKKIIKTCDTSIQVGDFGVGFMKMHGDFLVSYGNPPFDTISKGNHRFIRGNHDNPSVCKQQSYWIPDGTFEKNILFVGGAHSIDQHLRTEGLDWWRDEELSYVKLDKIISEAKEKKPSVLITHTFPASIVPKLFQKFFYEKFSATEQAFDVLFEEIKPKLWVAGHWHMSVDKTIDGTRFICLNELETIDLDLEEFK